MQRLPFISASKYLAAEDRPILCCQIFGRTSKRHYWILCNLHQEKISSMQRIIIEDFLTQDDPLHPVQYKDPLHHWVGSSTSMG